MKTLTNKIWTIKTSSDIISVSAAGGDESSDGGGSLNAAAVSSDKTSPFHVAVNISGERVMFQLDTAASVSVVGEHIYKSDESIHVNASRPSFTSYSGDSVDVLGKINVPVQYDGQSEL